MHARLRRGGPARGRCPPRRAGAGRHRRRGARPAELDLGPAAAGAGRRARPPGRGQLRQRLLRRGQGRRHRGAHRPAPRRRERAWSARRDEAGDRVALAVAGLAGLALARWSGGSCCSSASLAILATLGYSGGTEARTPPPGSARCSCSCSSGVVATVGSAYVQDERLTLPLLARCRWGLLATALLVVNNLRDIPTDPRSASARWRCGWVRPGTRSCTSALVVAPSSASCRWRGTPPANRGSRCRCSRSRAGPASAGPARPARPAADRRARATGAGAAAVRGPADGRLLARLAGTGAASMSVRPDGGAPRPPAPFRVPMRLRFRGVTERTGVLLHGPAGWGEFSPFPEYGPAYAPGGSRPRARPRSSRSHPGPRPGPRQHHRAGRRPATAHDLVARSGCTTAKVKVAETGPGPGRRRRAGRRRPRRARPDGRSGSTPTPPGTSRPPCSPSPGSIAAGGLEYVEQPCATLDELAEVRRRVHVPLAADESVRTADDPLRIAGPGRRRRRRRQGAAARRRAARPGGRRRRRAAGRRVVGARDLGRARGRGRARRGAARAALRLRARHRDAAGRRRHRPPAHPATGHLEVRRVEPDPALLDQAPPTRTSPRPARTPRRRRRAPRCGRRDVRAENPSHALALVVVDELARCGVTDAVLAPGSRSAALAMAAARRPADPAARRGRRAVGRVPRDRARARDRPPPRRSSSPPGRRSPTSTPPSSRPTPARCRCCC
jgi:o-succinylbenzoate synthase